MRHILNFTHQSTAIMSIGVNLAL